jgi:hypothetical protein
MTDERVNPLDRVEDDLSSLCPGWQIAVQKDVSVRPT